MTERVPTLGVLGAGQLAWMLTNAANRLGVDVHVLRPNESSDRCSADRITIAALDDLAAVAAWAGDVDVVTVETENIPLPTLETAATVAAVHPAPESVGLCQDRLAEKGFLDRNGIDVARYVAVERAGDAAMGMEKLATPCVLKTRRFGYDGKGQRIVHNADEAEQAWTELSEVPCIIEELVPFEAELSVVAARDRSGRVAVYDPGRNTHLEGILRETLVPSRLGPDVEREATTTTRRILELQDYVGVLAVEFFVLADGLLVNEMAPRVHNSGHWTMEGCVVDQFEQHVRAVMGFPLGSTDRHADVEMRNIIGDDLDGLASMLSTPSRRIHLYGKRETRPGRKMGHVNQVKPLTAASS